jgi:hypothetical protein
MRVPMSPHACTYASPCRSFYHFVCSIVPIPVVHLFQLQVDAMIMVVCEEAGGLPAEVIECMQSVYDVLQIKRSY